ncbi:MAG: hypothetical protein K6G48_01255 [Acholeplasmatales bacterium]|nr:hypothetical protein [Acholeplasmatales bacterium]
MEMVKKDLIRTKIKILIISILFTIGVIGLFIINTSLKWGVEKVLLCMMTVAYVFFAPPMIRYMINWFKYATLEEAIALGYRIGYSGVGILIFLDPLIGLMYYFDVYFKKNRYSRYRVVLVGWYID